MTSICPIVMSVKIAWPLTGIAMFYAGITQRAKRTS